MRGQTAAQNLIESRNPGLNRRFGLSTRMGAHVASNRIIVARCRLRTSVQDQTFCGFPYDRRLAASGVGGARNGGSIPAHRRVH